jgi:CheY-like chemotaxis protein
MVILFLDDMEERHDLATAIAKEHGHEIIHAYTAEQAIWFLGKAHVDAASLDHDLADEHYSGPYASPATGGTAHSGRAVARWIAEHRKPPRVLVHSFNPVGAKAMIETLGETLSRHAPFGPVSWTEWVKAL